MDIEEKKKKIRHKVGRPKKRGPKKKRKSRAKPKPKIYKPKIKWDWKILATSNGKQVGYVGKYLQISEAYEELRRLDEDNKFIIFPQRFKNSHTMKEVENEYILLEKNRYGDKTNQRLPNSMGLYVEHISSNKNWIIIDKIKRQVEESFWVYGYDPVSERKTFQWILDNILLKSISTSYDIKQIFLYKNKVIFQNEEGIENFIICKNISDSIRFYNLLSEKCKGNRQIFFLGDKSNIGEARRRIEQELIEKTGWDIKKIQRKTTRP